MVQLCKGDRLKNDHSHHMIHKTWKMMAGEGGGGCACLLQMLLWRVLWKRGAIQVFFIIIIILCLLTQSKLNSSESLSPD